MAKKEEKTNVMRTLDQKKIAYIPHAYDPDGPIDGVSVARTLGQDPACVFKTLVTRGASGGYYVFDIPAAENLDLKKAARAVGEKSVAMLPQKELLPLTGYVHGGCSPVGHEKILPHGVPPDGGRPSHHHGVGGPHRPSGPVRPQGPAGPAGGQNGGYYRGMRTNHHAGSYFHQGRPGE